MKKRKMLDHRRIAMPGNSWPGPSCERTAEPFARPTPIWSLLSCAVSAALATHASDVVAQTSSAAASPSSPSDEIAEITVTAQRRVEDIQNVPVTIQVLTGDTMAQLNVTTFQDFLKYLPNVTAAGNGPGQSNIFMRGLSTGSQSLQGSGGVGSFPNVAVYLDEQSAQMPGRNLDIYCRRSASRSKCSRDRKERCSAPVRRPASCATSRTSRSST